MWILSTKPKKKQNPQTWLQRLCKIIYHFRLPITTNLPTITSPSTTQINMWFGTTSTAIAAHPMASLAHQRRPTLPTPTSTRSSTMTPSLSTTTLINIPIFMSRNTNPKNKRPPTNPPIHTIRKPSTSTIDLLPKPSAANFAVLSRRRSSPTPIRWTSITSSSCVALHHRSCPTGPRRPHRPRPPTQVRRLRKWRNDVDWRPTLENDVAWTAWTTPSTNCGMSFRRWAAIGNWASSRRCKWLRRTLRRWINCWAGTIFSVPDGKQSHLRDFQIVHI